jgi:putative endonuclease
VTRPRAFPAAERSLLGARAEEAVASYLASRGFSIVARNLRLGRLEIDVVARRDDLVAVVEVRARGRTAWTTGFGSIDGRKRQRIRRAGERLWQRRYKNDASVRRLRFDAASVTFGEDGPVVEYAEAAF